MKTTKEESRKENGTVKLGFEAVQFIWNRKLSRKGLESIQQFLNDDKEATPMLKPAVVTETSSGDEDEFELTVKGISDRIKQGLAGASILTEARDTPTINVLREGLSRSEIDQVAQMAELTKKEMATLLGRSERNRYYATSKRLSLLESEHLVALKLLFSQGQILFDGDTKAFSDWLRTPKQALAVPETGFPIKLPNDYQKPTIDELFAPHTEQQNKRAIEDNMAYNRDQSVEQTRPSPTPLSILDSPTGLRLVSAILGRIEAGVFS